MVFRIWGALVMVGIVATAPGAFASADNAADPGDTAKAKKWDAIDLRSFGDSIQHALMKFKDHTAPYPRYAPEQIVHIAENLLAYQNGDGGWPKNVDWLKILSDDEAGALPHGGNDRSGESSTLDNGTTWSQIGYLAQVYGQTGLKRYADAATNGIDYLLATQRESGGWRGADVDAITFNDGVMFGALRTLKTVSENKKLYGFVDEAHRGKAAAAFDRGIGCILKCQIKVNGRLTAWCQQHSHADFSPVWARTFEPPSITAGESVDVVRLLMELPNPSPEVVSAIQAAVAWLDKAQIKGLRLDKVPAEPVQFKYHFCDFDYVEVKDPNAPSIWARYYDLQTEEPIFCNRGKTLTPHYSDVDRERRTGYAWYGRWPAALLSKEYPAWQSRWAPNENVLTGGNH